MDLHPSKCFAIVDVNVIPMTVGGDVIPNAIIIVRDGIISGINSVIPDDAVIIDGRGKWLMPGLIDMHVHMLTDGHFNTTYPSRSASIFTSTQDLMTPFVANGVTTVLELNSMAGHFGQRNEINHGDVIGPRIALAAMINGGDQSGRVANTPSDGRQTVRNIKAEGYEFVKVYSQLNRETFLAIVDEANKQGMKVVGHIPNDFNGRLEEAFVPNFQMVAHAEEYAKQSMDYSDADAKQFAQLAKENGTWLSPTLVVIESICKQAHSLDSIRNDIGFPYVHPLMQSKWINANRNYQGTSPERVSRLESLISFNNKLVKAFHNEGVPIVAGTDAGSSGVIWGFSLHKELELLVKAGLSPKDALESATLLPAKWLGIEEKIGTVELGKFADLILLDANPLDKIQNSRKIHGVFFNGIWISRKDIEIMLSNLAKYNIANLDKYDWSKRSEY